MSPESNGWGLNIDTHVDAPVIVQVLDNVGSITGAIGNGGVTDDACPTLSGTAENGVMVYIYDGTKVLASVRADATGAWSVELPDTSKLSDGMHTLTAKAIDLAGNESIASSGWVLNVDTQIATPTISNIVDNVGTITGSIRDGGVTDDTRPTLSGAAEANSIVYIREGTTVLASVRATSSGTWSLELPSALSVGSHTFNVYAVDAAGNTSQQSNTRSIIIDTSGPSSVTIDSIYDNFGTSVGYLTRNGTTDDQTPTLSGKTEANAKVYIYDGSTYLGSATANSSGIWTYTTPSLSYASHTFTAIAYDEAGNSSARSASWTITIQQPAPSSITEDFNAYGGTSLSSSGRSGTTTNFVITAMNGSSGAPANGFVQGIGTKTGGVTSPTSSNALTLTYGGSIKMTMRNGLQGTTFSATIGDLTTPGVFWDKPEQGSITFYDSNGYQIDRVSFIGGNSNSNPLQYISRTMPSGKSFASFVISFDYGFAPLDSWFWMDNVVVTGVSRVPGVSSMSMMSSDVSDDTAVSAIDDKPHHDDETAKPVTEYQENTETLIIKSANDPVTFTEMVNDLTHVNVVDMNNGELNVLNISLGDVLAHGEEYAFIADDSKQLLIKGDKGDVVNLSDLLPDGTDTGDWAKAEGTVTVGGVQYEVYQHTGAETELLVQLGVQTNLNNH